MPNRMLGAARIAVCLMVAASGVSAQFQQEPPEFTGPKLGDRSSTSGRADKKDAETVLTPIAAPPGLGHPAKKDGSLLPVNDGSGSPDGPLPPIQTSPKLGGSMRGLGHAERRTPTFVGPNADGRAVPGGPLAPDDPRRVLEPHAGDVHPGILQRDSSEQLPPSPGEARQPLDRLTPDLIDRVAYWNMTGKAGLELIHAGGDLAVSAGSAWLDYDGDGDPDLYLTQTLGASKLYRNEGDGTFVDVTDIAGVGAASDITLGASAADFDGDGRVDLYLLNRGDNRLFANLGDGTFADVTDIAGVAGSGALSTSAAWADFDLDGDLDLYVSNAGDPANEADPIDCRPNHLFRNAGDGTFEEVAASLGVAGQGCTFSSVFSDLDGDGDPDLLIGHQGALAFELTRLYRNEGGWFQEQPFTNQFPVLLQTVGLAAGDIDRDGQLDALLAGHGANALALNLGGIFHDVATAYGVGRPARAAQANGQAAAFFDYDNDGHLDLMIADGDDALTATLHLYRNLNGAGFLDVTGREGLLATPGGRTISPADFDQDGDIDLLIGVPGGAYKLLVNVEGNAKPSLAVRARQGAAPAIGARIQLEVGATTQTRIVGSEATLASAPDPAAHFGLDQADHAERLLIDFPNGTRYELRNVAADQVISIASPKLTIVASQDSLIAQAGQLIHYSLTFGNETENLALAAESWIDVTANGGPEHALIPTTRIGTLLPGAEVSLNVSLVVPIGTPPGVYTLVHRIGQRGAGLSVHQAYVDVLVQ